MRVQQISHAGIQGFAVNPWEHSGALIIISITIYYLLSSPTFLIINSIMFMHTNSLTFSRSSQFTLCNNKFYANNKIYYQ